MEKFETQKIFRWFEQFNEKIIKIEGKNNTFLVKIHNNILPHLLGIQYVQTRHSKEMKGGVLLDFIKKNSRSDEEILKSIEIFNSEEKANEVQKRINSIKNFFENLEECIIVENTAPKKKENIKSEFFLIYTTESSVLHLGLKKNLYTNNTNDFYLETFFERDNKNNQIDDFYFKNTSVFEKVTKISSYDKEKNDFETFTFKDKNKINLSDIEINGEMKNLIKDVRNFNFLKQCDENGEKEFEKKLKRIFELQTDLKRENIYNYSFKKLKEKIPILTTFDENLEIKNFLIKISNFSKYTASKKEEVYDNLEEIKEKLEKQSILEKNKANLFFKKEFFKTIDKFFDKITTVNNIDKALEYLEKNEFPEIYVNHFKDTFKIRIENEKKLKNEKKIGKEFENEKDFY